MTFNCMRVQRHGKQIKLTYSYKLKVLKVILGGGHNFKTGSVEELEANDSLEKNWDVFPDFGQYIHLCNEER